MLLPILGQVAGVVLGCLLGPDGMPLGPFVAGGFVGSALVHLPTAGVRRRAGVRKARRRLAEPGSWPAAPLALSADQGAAPA